LVALIINFHSTRLRTPNICGAPLKENHREKYFSARSARRNGGRRGSAAAITDASPASAQAGAKPIFPVPATTIPIVGETDVFRVRRIYYIGRNYAAHAIERGSDPNREPPFFFQKPTDAIQNVAIGEVADHPYPSLTKNYQHEVELVAALKSGGTNIPPGKAL
jgi:fumarylpyruvate hydrolase